MTSEGRGCRSCASGISRGTESLVDRQGATIRASGSVDTIVWGCKKELLDIQLELRLQIGDAKYAASLKIRFDMAQNFLRVINAQ
jgi:hypothetical protein